MVEREEMRKKKTELLIKALELEEIVLEQKRKNLIKQEEKSKIKINLNMDNNDTNNHRMNSTEEISKQSNLLQELKKLSSNIPLQNKCKYLVSFL